MLLSIVIPCRNETANLPELYRRLNAVIGEVIADRRLNINEAEFVFVDDGSTDETLEHLRMLAMKDNRLQVVALSRNFGHQAALSAGIDYARGNAVVVMDADLQHPPEMIPQFVTQWRAGYELVYAYRDGARPRLGYRLINALMKVRVPPEAADFRLMDRRVVEAFRNMPERARFIRGMLSWLGFRQTGIPYDQPERFAGHRTYTIRQTGRMALYAVLAFSSVPLRMASVLGLMTLLAGLGYAVYILYARMAGWPIEPGWTALILTVLILGGVQLLCLGVIAEYIGCIFEEVKHRPLYVVREHITTNRNISSTRHQPDTEPPRTPKIQT
ncbi:MAG: glycosyltransferase family 2 protein [Phycisphaerales bacterium]|nr:glycosyltransferase family 2 protein [Phycisphaerales bacterium]